MRIHFIINSKNEVIPFIHQHLLTGTIHKWLGYNNEHGKVSLYSFSNLQGGKLQKDGLQFKTPTSFFFSAHDENLIKRIISGVRKDPTMFCGLEVKEVIIEEYPNLTNKEQFILASPILLKKYDGTKTEHILFNDTRANSLLKETINTKMKEVGIKDDSLELKFDLTYPKPKIRLITYNTIKNKTSLCPIIIKGEPITKLFIWNVGLGNSTGIGFGSIM